MSKKPRAKPARRTQIETLEQRQVMSADPLGGLFGGPLEHHTIVEEPPSLVHHAEPPALVHHTEPPSLVHHAQREWDFRIDPNESYSFNDTIGDVEQTLNSAHGLTGLNSVRADYGFTGIGQTVAVIDSGIAYDHYALGGGYGANYRVVGGWDFTENDADPYDDGAEGSHGTHVSGIVGGTGNTSGNDVGVAPGVDLVGLRVFDDAGNGSFGWVEDALQWVIANRTAFENPITAVNMSLGTTWNSDVPPAWGMALLGDELAQLEADGVFISVSAGNSFTSYNTPGLSYPAASPYVVPVMSIDDSGSLSYFSQRHSNAIAAPGRFIRSTIPDYAGNNNGITDDWANFSGTSMAAPYVAGASVLIREAMELMGQTNISQDTIYNHMIATADSFFDSATSQNYNRLNLAAAIDALLPSDDYGSTSGTAHSLGTISDDLDLSGMVSKLDDADYFSFTAGVTGTATFSASTTHHLAADWDFGSHSVTQNGGDWVMDVVAGQTYTVGLATSDGLGYYDMDIALESSFSFIDWGSVNGQQSHNDLINSGETWYRIVAGQAGYVTAEAFFDSGQGDIDIAYYDANQSVLAGSSQVTGGERVDYIASAGEELFLRVSGANSDVDFRVTNQLAVSGATLTVTGTTGDDTISFSAGANYDVTVAGVDYSFYSGAIDTVVLDGSGGNDTVNITGDSADETFTLSQGSASVTSAGYNLTATSFENVLAVGGGGNDVAILNDTSGDEQFTAWSDRATFVGSSFSHEVQDFGSVTAYASGGNDTATFYDTDGDDIYTTWWNRAIMYGTGYWNDAQGFDQTTAHATNGNDIAVFRDTDGDDVYTTWWNRAIMYGSGYWNDAQGFDKTTAYATNGNDIAVFRDTAGDDVYTTWWNRAIMFGNGYWNDAQGFDKTTAYATGGNDIAVFRDTDGDDVYTTWWNRAIMFGNGYWNDAQGFDKTTAYATNGNDVAVLRDTDGDDVYTTWWNRAILYGNGYWNDAQGFDKTTAYASGGNDIAVLRDSAGDDVYTTWWNRAIMFGTGYWNDAQGFDKTTAYASGGNDIAILRDTDGNDVYTTWWNRAIMYGDGYWNEAVGFDQATGSATNGYDITVLRDSSGHDEIHASGSTAYMTSDNYHNQADGFDLINVYDEDGDGSDEAFVGAVDAIFNLLGNWS